MSCAYYILLYYVLHRDDGMEGMIMMMGPQHTLIHSLLLAQSLTFQKTKAMLVIYGSDVCTLGCAGPSII